MSAMRIVFSIGVMLASDWPAFLGPTRDGKSPERGVIAPWPAEGLKVLWHRSAGMGYGTPAIAKDRLYLFDRHGDRSRLTCMEARTGKEHWRFEYAMRYTDAFGYNNGPRACPVVDDERVYLHGVEGMIHCLDVRDGKVLWKVDTRAAFGMVQNFFGVASVPIIEGDMLLVHVGGCKPIGPETTFGDLRPNGTALVAFDKKTGVVRYKAGDDLASYATPVVASVGGKSLCFVFGRAGLTSLESATGKVMFHFPWRAEDIESVNAANPVVVHDQIFVTECYGPGSALLQLKSDKPETIWSDAKKRRREKSLLGHWSTPIHHEGYLYGCSGRNTGDAELRCIELASGNIMWSQPRLSRTSLLMVDGHLVCLGEDGELRLLRVNPRGYDEVSKWTPRDKESSEPLLEYPCWAAPILSNGLLYVRSEKRLVCLQLIPED